MDGNMIQAIWNWCYHVYVMIDEIYLPFAQCSLLEALLGMMLIGAVLSLILPWVYFEGDQDI